MSLSESQIFEINKELWNKRTIIHLNSKFYNRQGFINGETVLTPIELSEMPDVKGKSLLHLQCHFGLDSLNWARLGANVTGIDISNKAIEEAKKLNDELGYNANFICSDVYSLLNTPSPIKNINSGFDIVFTSYGTIGWLPDLNKWAKVIATYLKPNGVFYIADFHPFIWMYNDDFTKIEYDYTNNETIIIENAPTYTEDSESIMNKEYSWNHSISEILNALLQNGLKIKFFNEYNYSPYPNFKDSTELEKGKWYINNFDKKVPIVYSIMAIKK